MGTRTPESGIPFSRAARGKAQAAISPIALLVIALAAFSGGEAGAEPRIDTTAVQTVQIASWGVWWGGLVALVVAAHLLMRAFPRSRDRSRGWPGRAIVVSAAQLLTGGLTLFGIVLVSIGYAETDPWAFIVPWLVFWAGSTLWTVVVGIRR